MSENVTKVWKLTDENRARRLDISNASTLDNVTRQLPQGYYSTFRTFEGGRRVIGLQAHLQRIYDPATEQEIKPSISIDALRHQMTKILSGYYNEARVRLMMTYGGEVYLAVAPLVLLPTEIYQNGVKAITVDVQRDSPRLKSTAFIEVSKDTRAKIAHSQVFEALLMRKDVILEGMTSNFFYVKDGLVGTARNNILLGVTRRTVLRVIRGSGFGIVYRPLKREQVSALSEAFLTSSSRGIVPIVQIDDVTVGEGLPGSITKNLMDGYRDYVTEHAEII